MIWDILKGLTIGILLFAAGIILWLAFESSHVQNYQKPGALYCGQDITSSYVVGVTMTSGELHQFADTISSDTDFQKMLDYLAARAKTNPAPLHKFQC